MSDVHELLSALSQSGWRVARAQPPQVLLPSELLRRYPRVPAELVEFLALLESCHNREYSVWFLVRDDYQPTRSEPFRFRWNELEQMSLDAAEGDLALESRIRAYWDQHFPFLVAVHSGYDYLAVDLHPARFGQIVHGSMPDAEESTPVAGSFAEWLDAFIPVLRGAGEYPLSLFV